VHTFIELSTMPRGQVVQLQGFIAGRAAEAINFLLNTNQLVTRKRTPMVTAVWCNNE